jgi:hypothetical protein
MSAASSRTDLDSPWKDVLDRYFPAFLQLLFPDIHAAIDWRARAQHLDSELRRLLRAARTGGRRVDKLVRVSRCDGQPLLVLIHVEVQSQADPGFAQRMFTYHYKILDRYAEPVVSLAVLADARASWRPQDYSHALWGCRLTFSFPVAKLTDWLPRQAELEESRNPFATVVLAHLRHHATRTDPLARMAGKLQLTRALYQKGFTAQQVRDLFAFIDWVLTLPEELDQQFDKDLIILEKEQHMPYVTGFERRAIARGEAKGEARGIAKGEARGIAKGRQRALASTLQRLLARRFGPLPQAVRSRLQDAPVDELERLLDEVLDAPSLEALFPDA